jgi:predicted HNH restriction endonuclease
MADGKSYLVQWQVKGEESWVGKTPHLSEGHHMKGITRGDRIFVSVTDDVEIHLLGALEISGVGVGRGGDHLAKGKTLAGPFQMLPLGSIKWKLRFEGKHPRLSRSKSLFWQVKTRRRLEPESAEMLLTFLRHSGTEPRQAAVAMSELPVSKKQYREALEQIRTQISPIQLRLLEAHYLAPEHAATAEELALAAGEEWRVTNLQYGLLGTRLRRALGRPKAAGEEQATILASFEGPVPARGFHHWRWFMRSPLVVAIEELKWFGGEDAGVEPPWIPDPETAAVEGQNQALLANHRRREQSLRRAKIEASRRSHPNGRLICEVPGCGFDFEAVYGQLGEGFAEVHHLRSLSEMDGPVLTTLADLSVVCANCHRMIHRGAGCRPLDAVIPNSNAPRGCE